MYSFLWGPSPLPPSRMPDSKCHTKDSLISSKQIWSPFPLLFPKSAFNFIVIFVNKYVMAVTEHLPCAMHCIKYLTWIITLNPYGSPMKHVLLSSLPFYRKINRRHSTIPWPSEAKSGSELQVSCLQNLNYWPLCYATATSFYFFPSPDPEIPEAGVLCDSSISLTPRTSLGTKELTVC